MPSRALVSIRGATAASLPLWQWEREQGHDEAEVGQPGGGGGYRSEWVAPFGLVDFGGLG